MVFVLFLVSPSNVDIAESATMPDDGGGGSPPGSGGGSGSGGGTVPIVNIKLTDNGKDYNVKPSRLTFKLKNERYAIQVRKIEEEYVKFHYFSFKKGSYKDVRNYKLEGSFNLEEKGIKKIDLNNDGYYDLYLELKQINKRTVEIFLKKINEKYSVVNYN